MAAPLQTTAPLTTISTCQQPSKSQQSARSTGRGSSGPQRRKFIGCESRQRARHPPGQTTVVTLIASLRGCYAALSASQKSRVGHRVRPQSHAAAASPGILINWVDCFEQAPLDEFGTLFGIQYCLRKSCRCRVHADPGKRRMMVNLQPEESLPAELLNFLLHDSRDHPCPQCGEIPRREVSDLQLPRILACATLGSGVKLISRGPTSGPWPSHEISPAIL